ncbi:MAG: hypothetical protein C0190_02785 [Thermodesulfobacterium geofontis]|uniref:Uncharacterized protein n=1 Tax=Thermodesulfobacterium geofontis TaxID=1295609 RepID=A0A2N7QDQ7_9BACT|nr:MAG: hypothetical protein C0190_02785 [Thermodesulfobacterium geofontis]PMP96735.1 MAG: hypothetical protein C0169_04290 [Thermodesulfobacterium geofontis]
MEKNWEEFSEKLASEIKREIIENYLSEKFYLEEEWKNYQGFLENLQKIQKRIFNNAWRIYFILDKDENLIKEFENLTSFPLKISCEKSLELYKDIYGTSEEELKKRLFSNIFSPFGFTSKGKFVKLFYNIYKRLYNFLNNYLKEYRKVEKTYNLLKDETEKFHKSFDLSYILGFFERLEISEAEIGGIENKEKIIKDLVEKLKIPIPEPLESIFIKYSPLPLPTKVSSKLSHLARISFEKNPENAKKILSLLA